MKVLVYMAREKKIKGTDEPDLWIAGPAFFVVIGTLLMLRAWDISDNFDTLINKELSYHDGVKLTDTEAMGFAVVFGLPGLLLALAGINTAQRRIRGYLRGESPYTTM